MKKSILLASIIAASAQAQSATYELGVAACVYEQDQMTCSIPEGREWHFFRWEYKTNAVTFRRGDVVYTGKMPETVPSVSNFNREEYSFSISLTPNSSLKGEVLKNRKRSGVWHKNWDFESFTVN